MFVTEEAGGQRIFDIEEAIGLAFSFFRNDDVGDIYTVDGQRSLATFVGCGEAAENSAVEAVVPSLPPTAFAPVVLAEGTPNPSLVEISLEESAVFIEQDGTGILYYGREGCPFCKLALPIITKAAEDEGVLIYYIDAGRSTIDNDDSVTLNSGEGMKIYQRLFNLLVSTFDIRNEAGEPTFSIPLVVGIKSGEIVGHRVGLPDSFKMVDESSRLSDSEYNAMYQSYVDIISAVEN